MAIGERAPHAKTEPLIQQGGACPIPTGAFRTFARTPMRLPFCKIGLPGTTDCHSGQQACFIAFSVRGQKEADQKSH